MGLFGPKEPAGFFKPFAGWHRPSFDEVAFEVPIPPSTTQPKSRWCCARPRVAGSSKWASTAPRAPLKHSPRCPRKAIMPFVGSCRSAWGVGAWLGWSKSIGHGWPRLAGQRLGRCSIVSRSTSPACDCGRSTTIRSWQFGWDGERAGAFVRCRRRRRRVCRR
jgi:hypothetical protein